MLRIAALLSLAAAYLVGQFLEVDRSDDQIRRYLPVYRFTHADWSRDAYRLTAREDNQPKGHLLIKSAAGWGGPMRVAIRIDDRGVVSETRILSHKETPSFLSSMRQDGFFEQFSGKTATDSFMLGRDIDAVSGATLSSRAFIGAVRLGLRDAGNNLLKLGIPPAPKPWEIGVSEIVLILLYIGASVFAWRKYLKLRKWMLAFSIVFIGFYMGGAVSIAHFGTLLLGYLPPLKSQLFWWLLVAGAVLPVIVAGKNTYCLWVCPFGGIQEWIATTAGFRIKVHPRLLKWTRYSASVLLWLSLTIIFLSANPGLGMYEPFATLFSFKGEGVQWCLVSVSIFSAFVIPRFWCRFFCPVGAFFRQVIGIRKGVATWCNTQSLKFLKKESSGVHIPTQK